MNRTKGTTLIEVVAGLALLGMLLSALIVLRSRYIHRLADVQRRSDAIAAADQLLGRWWTDRAQFPRTGSGLLTDREMAWRIGPVPNEALAGLSVDVVRLEVLDARPTQENKSLATVDVALPDRKPLIRIDARRAR